MGIAHLMSTTAKLVRADEHFQRFEMELRGFVEQNAKTARIAYGHRVREWYPIEVDPIPAVPQRLVLIAGDCLNNIRAALDHLVWQLVLREDQEPRNTHQYPICESSEKFIERVRTPAERGKNGPLSGITIDGDAWTIIEATQPYHRTEPHMDPLALLDKFAQIDKHRALLVQQTVPVFDRGTFRVIWRSDLEPIERQYTPAPLSAEQPTEIARFRFAPGVNPGVNVEGKFRIEPRFGDGETKTMISHLFMQLAHRHVVKIVEQVAALPRVELQCCRCGGGPRSQGGGNQVP